MALTVFLIISVFALITQSTFTWALANCDLFCEPGLILHVVSG